MELCRLMVEIKTFGFENETIPHEVMSGTLENVDSYTYRFQNEKAWFAFEKEKILANIKRKRIQSGKFIPNDIEFLRVYILKKVIKITNVPNDCGNEAILKDKQKEVEIRPLFKEIQSQNQVVLLENVIKNRMFKGNLEMFYQLTCELGDDVGFFLKVPDYLQMKMVLSLDGLTINAIYRYLSIHERFMALARLLLLVNPTYEEMKVEYKKVFGSIQENNVKEGLNLERIRMPYKDKDE